MLNEWHQQEGFKSSHMVGPRKEAMISKALSVDELWRPEAGGGVGGAASINTPFSSLRTHHFLQDSLPSGLLHSLASHVLISSLLSI